MISGIGQRVASSVVLINRATQNVKGERRDKSRAAIRARGVRRRRFASDFITRNVAVTVSCSCSCMHPCPQSLRAVQSFLSTHSKLSTFSRSFYIAGFGVEDRLWAPASFPVLTYPIPGSSTQICLPRLQESRQYFLVQVTYG